MDFEKLNTLLDWSFYDNSARHWLYALLIFILVFSLIKAFQKIFIKRLKKLFEKTKTPLDDFIIDTLSATKSFFIFVVSIYAGSLALKLSPAVRNYIEIITIIVLLLQVGIWGKRFIDSYLKHYRQTHLSEEAANITTVHALGVISKIVIYTMVLLLILENLGINVTALITGLGIGGIAVALAAQNLLKDFFSAIIIALDKPFVVGDFIVVSGICGTIEHVGIKTTRIRSLGGEQIVLCNSQLLEGKIQNYKRMATRRIVFSLGVTYDTSSEKLKKIPELIKGVIEGQEKTTFDRAHFKNFGDFSLNFEVVYHVMDKDYNLYMDIQESINLELYRRFTQEGIDFAFPTQTLYVEKAGEMTPSSLPTN